MDGIESERKKNTLISIVRWVFGAFFLIMSLGAILGHGFIAGLLFLLAAIVAIPPAAEQLENRLNVSMSGIVRFFVVFLLVAVAFAAMPNTTATTATVNNSADAIAVSEPTPTPTPTPVSTPTPTPAQTPEVTPTKTLADKEPDSNYVTTDTPTPDVTPRPEPTPDVTPIPVPDSTSQTPQITEPAPIELSGTGQKATQKFQLEQGLSEFSMTYHGSDNFIVWLMDGNTGQNVELLANQIGSFSGSKAVGITSDGDYILNVQSNGPWTVTIKQPRQAATQSSPLTLQGTGQQVSEMFSLDEGLKTFDMTYHGSDNFIVWLMDGQGNRVDLLANQIGSFNGSKAVGIPQTGTYLLDITSNGKWEVSIE